MRPIKFRAWDNHDKVMDFWNVLSFPTHLEGKISFSQIMQFTGLLDKNGKEIYFGDIVKGKLWFWREEKIFEVKFDEYYYGILPFVEKYQSCEGEENLNSYSCEVIGNIYEHSHLLK